MFLGSQSGAIPATRSASRSSGPSMGATSPPSPAPTPRARPRARARLRIALGPRRSAYLRRASTTGHPERPPSLPRSRAAHPGLTFFDEAGRVCPTNYPREIRADRPALAPQSLRRARGRGPDRPGPDFVQDQPSTATLVVAAPSASPIRASYFERRECRRPHQALSEGRLDLAATEVSIAAAYAATYRHELASLMADLPDTALISPGIPSTLPTWHGGTATGIPPALHALLRTPARCLTHPSRARRSEKGPCTDFIIRYGQRSGSGGSSERTNAAGIRDHYPVSERHLTCLTP